MQSRWRLARVRGPLVSPEELTARLQRNPDCAAPTDFATFNEDGGQWGAHACG
jgi:hypothetical protein